MVININNQIIEIQEPMSLKRLANQYFKNQNFYGAIVDGKLCELNHVIDKNVNIEWVDSSSETGRLIYERTLTFLFLCATKKVFKEALVRVEHTIQGGLFCRVYKNNSLTQEDIDLIKQKMNELIQNKSVITRVKMKKQEAIRFFNEQGLEDKAQLLQYRSKEMCSVYTMEGISNYFYGFMLPDVSYIHQFDLSLYKDGVRLGKEKIQFNSPKLFEIMQSYEKWGELIKVPTIAKLNEKIISGKANELMLMSEAMIEKNLAELAQKIADSKNKVKLILISGPSSAGKTTFSKRLSIHLKILGIEPINISMDDFYLNRLQTPKLPDGSYDFENIEAIDLKLFNEVMQNLIDGKPVKLPTYNFKTGLREYNHSSITLQHNQIMIVEGIHGLNPRSSTLIENQYKVKIYINALTHLNYDFHNRISTSDYRLIRRIVRDYQFRNLNARETINHWKNVKFGEDQYIYPYQEEADYIFNTSMVYELAVLKPIAQKLLVKIQMGEKEYIEANRLNKLLNFFVDANISVPQDSILAEFVGNSIFE